MKRIGLFVACSIASVLLLAYAGTRLVHDPEGQRAITMSAGIALGIQFTGFAFANVLAQWNALAAWGGTILLRFLAVAFHALLGIRILGLPAAPALLSLVAFLFVTSLFEPLFLPHQKPPTKQ